MWQVRSALVWEEFQFSVPPSGQGCTSATLYSLLSDDYHSSCDGCITSRPKKKKKKRLIFQQVIRVLSALGDVYDFQKCISC